MCIRDSTSSAKSSSSNPFPPPPALSVDPLPFPLLPPQTSSLTFPERQFPSNGLPFFSFGQNDQFGDYRRPYPSFSNSAILQRESHNYPNGSDNNIGHSNNKNTVSHGVQKNNLIPNPNRSQRTPQQSRRDSKFVKKGTKKSLLDELEAHVDVGDLSVAKEVPKGSNLSLLLNKKAFTTSRNITFERNKFHWLYHCESEFELYRGNLEQVFTGFSKKNLSWE
eukprot:TRINITY_DN20434_c0_g1_i1.p1 TRINITY_DN20434_c0_g1~~TRINITY_DN20434_c0_g1_i1.p1  ORF type:complete len:242 (-),score=31.85 TRINITY_DN20434_c0_g1_i1:106-771(-)